MRNLRGNGDVVEDSDHTTIINDSGQPCLSTVRRVDCELLCTNSGTYPSCCQKCQTFRSTLHSARSRLNSENLESQSLPNSHTKYCHLTPAQNYDRMKSYTSLYNKLSFRLSDWKQRSTQCLRRNESPLPIVMLMMSLLSLKKLGLKLRICLPLILHIECFGINRGSTTS